MFFHHIGRYINKPQKCSLKDKLKFWEFDRLIDNYNKMKQLGNERKN